MGRKKKLSTKEEILFGSARTGGKNFKPPENISLEDQIEWYKEYYNGAREAAKEYEEKRKS